MTVSRIGITTILAGTAVTFGLMLGRPTLALDSPPAFSTRTNISSPASPRPVATLEILPREVTLVGARARHGLLVSERRGADLRDVTQQVRFRSLDPTVAVVDATGVIAPVMDGETRVRASLPSGATCDIRVRVMGAREERPVSFAQDVIPVLTRAGCNQGTCHGAQYGKGGFKLSLFGYDPDLDHAAIVKEAEGRRVLIAEPERSLFLQKPAAQMPHGGGQRFAVGSPEYRLLLSWLRESAPPPLATDALVRSIRVWPSARVMAVGRQQHLLVEAELSDGSVRDVTAQARIESLNDGLAAVTPTGTVSALHAGETAIMIRYQGQAAVARITVPYARIARYPDVPESNFIDALVERKWRELGLVPSALCSDTEFLRRVSLDAIGVLPTPDEVRAFLADTSPDKRRKRIDALLERPEYVDYWTLKWGDVLRNNRTALGDKGMWSFYNWLRSCIRENRPADRIAQELITAQGSTFTNGPANYFRVARTPPDLAETTSQVFLGVRLQCARCHHHPFEKWSQDDYYSLAAYFARVSLKGSQEFGIFGGEQVVLLRSTGEVNHPKKGIAMKPAPLDGAPADDPADRRRALAAWITSPRNPFFARNLVNRYWGMLMGRGIVEPVDDIRVTNPPSNPELLDALAADFVAHRYDLKQLVRTILNSRTYQLSATATRENRADEVFFSHFVVKRLPAEPLLDAINQVTGTTEKFAGLPLGFRAVQLPDPGVSSYFLDTFGRPPRQIACECERTGVPNISQALHLMNGDLINRKIADANGLAARLLASERSDTQIARELYLAALGRLPTPTESARSWALVHKAPSRKVGFEDLLWTLLNTREFLFNH